MSVNHLRRYGGTYGAVIVTVGVCAVIGSGIERVALAAALVAFVLGVLGWHCVVALRFAAAAVSACIVAFALHFALDHTAYQLVWLYSAPSLPLYLKLANLWGSDEASLLFVGWIVSLLAAGWAPRDGVAARGAGVVALFFLVACLVWDPFAQTAAEALSGSSRPGANAHLVTPWMALHPPLVLAGYALVLAPLGIIVAASHSARAIPLLTSTSRAAWLLLTGGIAVGMWWAYEDLTFGQFWHWDPVQTSLFVAWALLSAQLHTLRPYRASRGQRFARLVPQLSGWCAAAALLAMAITRSPLLASSHRYVGATSLPWLLLGLVALVVLLFVLLFQRGDSNESRATAAPRRNGNSEGLAIAVLLGAAAVALIHLVQALAAEWLNWPRDASLRPFFETLTRWSDSEEIMLLRSVFAQWEVNPFTLNQWLLPLAVAGLLLFGHAFVPLQQRASRRLMTCVVAASLWFVAWWVQPFTRFYDGAGMTSQQTTELFVWIDLVLLCAFYGAAVLAWFVVANLYSTPKRKPGRLSLGLVHGGAALTIVALLAATVFDSYAQRQVELPRDYGQTLAFPDGYSVSLEAPRTLPASTGDAGFQAVARVNWKLQNEGRVLESQNGETLYHDTRPEAGSLQGSVRQLCELLDYRYARFSLEPQRMLRPFIHRGVWRDVQLWLALPPARQREGEWIVEAGSVPVVLKIYPFASWVWVGLALLLFATALRWRERPREEVTS